VRNHESPRLQACSGIGKVVENTGGDDQVEVAIEVAKGFNRQMMELQVLQPIALFEPLMVRERGGAYIQGHDLGSRIGVGENGRLIGAAAGDQDVEWVAVHRQAQRDPSLWRQDGTLL